MKKNNVLYIIMLFFLFLGGQTGRVYAIDERFFASTEELDSIVKYHREKIIFQDQDPNVNGNAGADNGNLYIHYMSNRRALTGRHCTVNKLINVVGVGAWNENMNNLTNDDLNDYATFPSIVGAGVTVDPIVSIRDMKNYYSKGTQAGYCIVASSGDAVLSLDVIKALSIGFYREGKLLGTKAVEEGQDGAGVNLSLIQVPGSDEACITLTATSDWVFDEISLDRAGGVQVSVGNILKIKYAFVGKAREFTITTNPDNGIPAYQTYSGNTSLALQKMEGWNPVLLGLPFPFVKAEIEKMTNADYTDYASLTPILVIGYQGGAKFSMKDNTKNEIYPKGTEVGFKYLFGSGLALDAGAWISLLLFDRNGKVIQEETVSAGVLNLSVAKGGSGTASVTATQDFSGAEIRFHTVIGINLGMMGIHYGFIREKPDVDHHCPINPSVDMNLCETQSSLQLQSNPDISVTWTLVEAHPDTPPAAVKVTPGGYVTGLQKGTYVFRATASDGCYEEVMITSGVEGTERQCGVPFYNDPLTTDKKYELSNEIYGSSGSLISISDLQTPGNILDKNLNNFATYTGGLSIASDLRIIGVKTSDRSPIHTGYEEVGGVRIEKPIRIGFIVEFQATGLDLSLLQFFQIRCYREGKEVYSHVIEESNAVSAGLAGSDQVRKVRYSIEVPAIGQDGQFLAFDEFMLWKSGVLDLGLSQLNIYYAFMEEADSDCNDPLGCGSIILSHDITGTTINANETKYGSAVSVANVTDNLGYLVDSDLNTAMTLVNTVTVGGGTTIAVHMGRTLDYHHQLGIVVDNKTYTAAINVGNWMTIETFYKGVSTGDKFTDWKVLGADVIGFGDKNYLFMQPKKRYDEVRMTIANVAGVLDIQRFYGFFLRKDVDNDGIPDCQDPESCGTTIGDIEINNVCVGETITVEGTGTIATDYYIYFSEPGINFIKVTADEQGYFSASYVTQTSGYHQMVFFDGSGKPLKSIDYSVHPTRTVWKTTASNTDWNKWDNWTKGSPYCCTDVVIPSDAKHYPVLDEVPTDADPDKYCCQYIHFEPHAAVEHTSRLNYLKAWTEMELEPNRYYMLSAPLKRMFTGDMFIPEAMNGVHTGDYFTALTADNTPQNRFNPRIYQRLWATTAAGRLMDGSNTTLAITETQWSKNFNHLAHLYQPGDGFSLWVDNGRLPAAQKFRFRFPKEHTEYNYYSDFDQEQLNLTETLAKDSIGRFVYESEHTTNPTFFYKNETRTVYTQALPLTITLTTEQASNHFLVGNPFMSHISVADFMAGNPGVQSVKIYDGNTANTVVAVDGQMLGTADLTTIAPMQSFFVDLGANVGTEANILFTEDMLVASPQSVLRNGAGSAPTIPSLRICAENATAETATLLVGNSGIFSEASGVESLFDNEVKPSLAIFTIQDEKAYDILGVDAAVEIPLGMFLQKEDTLTLRFQDNGLTDTDAYVLQDRETGISYSLQKEIVLPGICTNVGRFVLKQKHATAIKPVDKKEVYVTVSGEIGIVKSSNPDIVSIEVYTLNGWRFYSQRFSSVFEGRVPLCAGLNILRVSLKDGTDRHFKVLL